MGSCYYTFQVQMETLPSNWKEILATETPLSWEKTFQENQISVDSMIALLKLTGMEFEGRPNGLRLAQYWFTNRTIIEEKVVQVTNESQAKLKEEERLRAEIADREAIREAIRSEQCPATLDAEAQGRLEIVLKANFTTARGLVLLESDMGLFDSKNPEAWIQKMREDWSVRLHSLWLDEFIEALELWVLSKLSI